MTAVVVALAGGLGAVIRYLIDQSIASPVYRWGTWLVNVTGSLAIGVLFGTSDNSTTILVVGTGFLGGYTTFSAASVSAANALRDGHRIVAALHTVGTAVACVIASAGGAQLGLALD